MQAAASRAPASEAALELGLLQQMLSRPVARTTLSRVAALADSSRDAGELARAGRALQALGQFQEANAAFRDAAGLAPANAAIQTAWGDLFLEKHNKAEAVEVVPGCARNRFPLRRRRSLAARARSPTKTRRRPITLVKRALEIKPNSVDAHVFLADQAIDAEPSGRSARAADKALAVNPSSLEAHAILAAMAYVDDKPQEFEAEVAKILAISPNYGDVYRIAGELAAHNYRFDEAVALTRRR